MRKSCTLVRSICTSKKLRIFILGFYNNSCSPTELMLLRWVKNVCRMRAARPQNAENCEDRSYFRGQRTEWRKSWATRCLAMVRFFVACFGILYYRPPGLERERERESYAWSCVQYSEHNVPHSALPLGHPIFRSFLLLFLLCLKTKRNFHPTSDSAQVLHSSGEVDKSWVGVICSPNSCFYYNSSQHKSGSPPVSWKTLKTPGGGG